MSAKIIRNTKRLREHRDYLLATTLSTCSCESLMGEHRIHLRFSKLAAFPGLHIYHSMALVNGGCAFLLWPFLFVCLFHQESLSSIWMSVLPILVALPISIYTKYHIYIYAEYQICCTSLMDLYMYTHVYLWQGKSPSLLSQLEHLWFS